MVETKERDRQTDRWRGGGGGEESLTVFLGNPDEYSFDTDMAVDPW